MTQIARRRNPRGVAPGTIALTRAKVIALAAAAPLLGAAAWLWPEVPHWRPGGTASTQASSVTYLPRPLACPASGTGPRTGIAIIGDSHVAGGRMGEEGTPFGAVLESALGGEVPVMLSGIGGGTAADGERRWRGRDLGRGRDLARPGLVILAFGTNDAAPRGWLRDKTPVALTDFKASLTRQITHWRTRGHDVVLLAPPPGGSAAITGRLEPYRMATREVGEALGTAVLDPADSFAACPSAQPVLVRDALHLNARGHQCLGTWLAHQFCPPTG